MSQNKYFVILFIPEGDMEFLTQKELLAVLKTAKRESLRDFTLILVSYKHALRASEAAALTLQDLKDGCLDIKRKKGSLHTIQPLMPHKGEPLLDEIKALKAWLKVRPNDGSNALFTSQKGGALSREQVHRIFKGIAERAGIAKDKRFVHILKHSRATHLVGTMDIALLRQLLGHRNIQNTMIYAHANDKQASAAAMAAEMAAFRG
jgi:site-specific recombinase XerD